MKYLLFINSLIFIILSSACSTQIVIPKKQVLDENIPEHIQVRPYAQKLEYQDIIMGNLTMPRLGRKNSYGISITKELEIAYDAYLRGDGELALRALAKAEDSSTNAKFLWQVSFLKTQVFMMMGLSAQAMDSIAAAEKYELLFRKTNLNSRSLRGEVKTWLGEYKSAENDFYQVLANIGNWELPTSYMGPPANMDELVSTTTAQLRALTGLAAIYVLQKKYKKAIFYASEAEKRYNSVHYVANHGLYGRFLNLHLDSYYGRALNFSFLAAAKISLKQDLQQANSLFNKSLMFFSKINYSKGEATILMLKAQALNASGLYEQSNTIVETALELSSRSGFIDYIWRLEALRGESLLKLGKKKESEQAFRRAFNSLNIISGMLTNESSKNRFNKGKEDITYALINFDIENKDYSKLFEDLERSRARAFVDILATRSITKYKNKQLHAIKQLDKEINKQNLLNSGIGSVKKHDIDKVTLLIKQRAELSAKIITKDPQLASIVSIWTTTLEQVQKTLSNQEAMIYFIPTKGNEKIKYLLLTKANMQVRELALTQNKLQKLLADLRINIGRTKRSPLLKNKVVSLSKLIKDLQQYFAFPLTKANKVYIVANKNINFVPWGILDQDKQISLLPNGSWLNINKKLIKGNKNIIVGDPNFGGKLPQLKGAKEEAQALAKLYNTTPILFNDATLTNLRAEIGSGANILHLATHGIFYEDRPLESAIFFTKNKQLEILTAKDLFETPLLAKFVVLSACSTGLGKSMGDNDFLGLERSFYLGGTKSILSSLWEIEDEGTKLFMLEFHKYAKNGEYTLGWLKAKNKLKKLGYSPAVYAAFVLHGTDGKTD